MLIKPWNRESERIFKLMVKDGRAYTSDINFSRAFGRRFPELIDEDYLDIARIDKKKKTVFLPCNGTRIIPIPTPTSQHSRFMKFRFYKIF